MCTCISRQTSVHLHAIAQTPSRRWHRVDSVMNVAWVHGREKDGTRDTRCSMWWNACCAMYPILAFGCCQTVPVVGWTSPVRHLMSVDLPAPFGPMHATRDESDTWTVAFSMVTLSLRGYLKDTSTTLMRALPLDLTPASGTCRETAARCSHGHLDGVAASHRRGDRIFIMLKFKNGR